MAETKTEEQQTLEKEPVVQRFENIKEPDFRSIYANNALFQTGPFDFNIIFGEVMDVDADRQAGIVHQHVRVTMSPLHAKLFVWLMWQQVRAFETQFGKINVPPGMIQTPEAPPPPEKIDEK
jgi:hypothetical protein